MESFQGPLNSCFLSENLEVNYLEQGLVDAGRLKLEEDEPYLISSLEDNMPFLHMLHQCVESPQIFPLSLREPSFHTLVKLQQQLNKPWEGIAAYNYIPKLEAQSQAVEIESCVTHDLVDMQSPLKSESNDLQHSVLEKVGLECNDQERPISTKDCSKEDGIGDSAAGANPQSCTQCPKAQVATRERRKRKRTKQTKNKEEVEHQRMTHIAVERNRRRQMNDHLSVLKSLMPPSYIQRGDHASIIGGAIDFVKELEQLLQSLEAQKGMKKSEDFGSAGGLFEAKCGDGIKAEKKSEAVEVEVTVIQTHVNLKIQCQRRPGQLLNAIVALEDLRLTILHLNITSSQASVLYSFNLKIEENSKIGSASEIAEAVSHIFRSIN